MGFILNASIEEVNTKVFGNHFSLKPGQVKQFSDEIAHFMVKERGYLGLVDMPPEWEDLDYRESEPGKSVLITKKEEGINKRVDHLRRVIYNNEVSLRRDLEQANIKADPKVFASTGEVAAYREVVKYQKANNDATQAQVDELKGLEKQIQRA